MREMPEITPRLMSQFEFREEMISGRQVHFATWLRDPRHWHYGSSREHALRNWLRANTSFWSVLEQ